MRGAVSPLPIRLHGVVLNEEQGQLYLLPDCLVGCLRFHVHLNFCLGFAIKKHKVQSFPYFLTDVLVLFSLYFDRRGGISFR
jgi:hypothetical protein